MTVRTKLTRTRAGRWLPALIGAALAALAPAQAHAADPVALSVGHVDAVAPAFQAGALVMTVKDDTLGGPPVLRDPGDVVFHAKAPESEIAVPDDPRFAFLGAAGSPVWLLPMTQDQSLLWPGFSSEQISSGSLQGDALNWRLTDVEGPGEVFLFATGSFGAVSMSFRSDQPLPQSKAMSTGVHAHYNWAFTARGRYTLTFEVTATGADGSALTTGEVDYTFVVGGFADLGVELAIDGARDRYAPGDTVTLEAAQRPRTVLDRYAWSVKCPGDADFAPIAGADGPVHSFPAELADDGCEYRAALHADDDAAIATSEPVAIRVEVPFFGGRTVLSTGHVDAVAPTYADGALAIKVKDQLSGAPVLRDPADVVLHAKAPESEAVVPDHEDFAFLGEPGAPVWVLPQIQNDAVLWPGFSSEGIAPGTFVGDELTWTLTGVDGPGDAFFFLEDAVGVPIHRFRSDAPLPQAVTMPTGLHDHFNWAFTAPGRYTLTFEIAGTPVGGGRITSGEVAYEVLVGGFGDLGIRLSTTGAAGEQVAGGQVTLNAHQDPRTELDRYQWLRRCAETGDYEEVPGAVTGTYAFTVQAADDGCRYKAILYGRDDRPVAESEPVALRVRTDPDPGPGDPGPAPTPTPTPQPGPGAQPDPPQPPAAGQERTALRLRAATLRKRILSLRLRSSGAARATARVLRRGRVVARAGARRLPKGSHTVRFRLDRRLKPGRYRVRVRAVADGGATVRTIALRVPERR